MAASCSFETVFMPVERTAARSGKAAAYWRHAVSTIRLLRKRRPPVVWIQLPQVPLLWAALWYRRMYDRQAAVVADCHNAMFRPPWDKVPFGLSLLGSCDIVIVHNADMLETAVGLGVCRERLMVVEDPPATFPTELQCASRLDVPRPWFVFPASFAADEPIAELLCAAAATPAVSLLVTGHREHRDASWAGRRIPANVRFLGFLARAEFEALMLDCDAVVAFTRLDGVQLSACGEAVGAGKPMLISDTVTLRRQFPAGTVFVNSADPHDIARGMRRMQRECETLSAHMGTFRDGLRDRWAGVRAHAVMDRLRRKAGQAGRSCDPVREATPRRIEMMGCVIDNLSMEETLDQVEDFVRSGEPHQHVVVNVDKLVHASKDETLRRIINDCALINADGMPVVWASRLLGRPLKQRVSGVDLFEHLMGRAAARGWRVFLLGATQEVVSQVRRTCEQRYPGLIIAGHRSGYWRPDEEMSVVGSVTAARPDLLFVAISSPKKEQFLGQYQRQMRVPFAMGVGGAFDVVAGKVRRAPVWMQSTGLEWFYRFLQEPRRMFRRYFIDDPAFLGLLFKEAIRKRPKATGIDRGNATPTPPN